MQEGGRGEKTNIINNDMDTKNNIPMVNGINYPTFPSPQKIVYRYTFHIPTFHKQNTKDKF